MKDKAILVLTPGFPKDEDDTTCVTFPQIFIRHLKRLYPSTHIVVLAFQYPFFNKAYQWHGVEVLAFNGQNRGRLRRLHLWMKVRHAMSVVMRRYTVEGILSFWMGECSLLARYAASRYRLSSFTWLMGQDARKGNKYARLTKPSASSIISLSDHTAREFKRNYGLQPMHVIEPGIDTGLFFPPAGTRPIDIMGAGSLIPLKQYHVLIDIAEKLAQTNKALRVVICGEGPERDNLETLIAEKGLTANIELTGELKYAEVLKLMQSTRVFVHPSSYEGYGMVCAEALFAGAQVVSFCQPMDIVPKHMHIVSTPMQMKEKIAELLAAKETSHQPVLTCSIETTCRKVMALFATD